ncbi:MAG: glycosyltransferase [Steroidobacteraceae bacterium]
MRFFPILEHLQRERGVDLVVINDSPAATSPRDVARFCSRYAVIPARGMGDAGIVERGYFWLRGLLPATAPYEYADPFAHELSERILEFVGERRYDILYYAGVSRADTFVRLKAARIARRAVFDFVDSPYLKAVRESATVMGLSRAKHLVHTVTTRNWERRLRANTDCSIYISAADAAAAGMTDASTGKVVVVPNGILAEADTGEPLPADLTSGKTIGFLGNMGYEPNYLAALRLHDRIFRPLKARCADLKLVIVGRDPVPAIQRLASEDVIVTGTVDNIMPYIDAIDVWVLPMFTGAGLQNKAIEIMSRGRPVLMSSICNSGIGARDGFEVCLADSDESFVDTALQLLSDPLMQRRIGEGGRSLTAREFDWAAITARLETVIYGELLPSARPQVMRVGAPTRDAM